MKTLILVKGSGVIKKFVLAISGLLLFTFVVVHLLGNLLIFSDNPNLINLYAYKLESMGIFLHIIEVLLLLAVICHAVYALAITQDNLKARPQKYYKIQSAGKPSQQNIFSRTMIFTGPILLIFMIFHLKTFRFGAGILDGYGVEVNGQIMRDFHSLIIDIFQQPAYAIAYILVMIPLGFHLRHGFQSALQSLGVNYPQLMPSLNKLSIVLSIILSLGFMAIPLYIYGNNLLIN